MIEKRKLKFNNVYYIYQRSLFLINYMCKYIVKIFDGKFRIEVLI